MTESVPAKAKPDSGVWCDLTQAAPRGLLPAQERKAVAAFVASDPEWDGVICVTGDVTHWVQVSAGEVVSFQSFATLRMAKALGGTEAVTPSAVEESLARPERLAAQLRAAELSGDLGAVLGHLLGAELAAARGYWLGVDLRVIGENPLADHYEAALRGQAAMVSRA
ncbi:2-dehydro-3-deoxygalactonokinase [Lentibacter algarum]|uniref:2-dehydro-3-deoxygalactonokinase n=1 Tax=Lentibacter algarum TaxID=576131 RepID=UPI001C076F4E|nr:2-dehydro-3-deoxygalactonokinase [Lentibacter algarum]MBU2980506.1 2-dehydro-3-deoxygalactonokinase [Lentibacter algarum]